MHSRCGDGNTKLIRRTSNLTRISDYLAKAVQTYGFVLMSATAGAGLPLVAFRLEPAKKRHYDEFAIAHQLRERGWVVPAYTMAPHSEKLKMMRVVIREDFSRSRCDALIKDIGGVLQTLKESDAEWIKDCGEQVAKKQSKVPRQRVNHHYKAKGHNHSLQGKHGKTHAVC